MNERRWPWVGTAVLMIMAGLARGAATYLTWLPCRDAVLTQTPLAPLFGRSPADVSDYCLSVMSGATSFPPSMPASWLLVLATVLTGVAVLVLLGLDWPRPTRRLVLALAGLILTQAVVLAMASQSTGEDALTTPLLLLMVLTDAAAFAVLVAVFLAAEQRRMPLLRGALAVVGVSGCGLVAAIMDYLVMFAWTGDYWEDAPPGTGYPLAVASFLAGLAVLTMTTVSRRRLSRAIDPEFEDLTI